MNETTPTLLEWLAMLPSVIGFSWRWALIGLAFMGLLVLLSKRKDF